MGRWRPLIIVIALTAVCVGDLTPTENQSTSYEQYNGVLYRVEKSRASGVETLYYYDAAGKSYTAEQLRAHVAAQQPQIVGPTLQARLSHAWPDDPIEITIMLRTQPAGPVSRAAWAAVAPQLEILERAVRAITRKYLPINSMAPAQERDFVPTPLEPADFVTRRALAELRDELVRQTRLAIVQQVSAAVLADQQTLAGYIEQLGGTVTMRVGVMNFMGARLPAQRVPDLAAHWLVARIDLNHPGEPELDNHRYSLGLETGFWQAGITGGVHDVGVLDTGVQQNHPALSSHRFLSNMGNNDTGTHGTGMAGILASTDILYRGMAYGCDTIVVARAGDINTSMPGMDYIASTGEPENVNYSFGNGTATDGDYMPTDQFFDGVISTFGFMVSKSTGNNGWGTTTITHPAPAYNLLASANMNDYNTIPRSDDRIDSSSSTGPTLAGRKKPDITAPGTNSMSCHPNGGFANIGGTSSASPHTGGGVVLLWDMGVTNAMACKAVLLNTTDAIDNKGTSTIADDEFVEGSHWNARYGWGYLNLGNAYLHGLDVFVDTVPDEPENADFRLYVGELFPKEKVTLVWQRHVAYNGATFPTQIESLSDLDLTAYAEADNSVLAQSWSRIDNVEQFHVEQAARTVLKVEAFGQFDPDIPWEQFALATQENFSAASGPAFNVESVVPTCVAPGSQFQVAARVTNVGDLAAHNVAVTLSGATVVSGPNPAPLGTIPVSQTSEAVWMVQASGTGGSYPLDLVVASSSYDENFSGSGQSRYRIAPGPPGDLNCDGLTSLMDINPFVLAVTNPAGYETAFPTCNLCNADINGDGQVNFGDINPFVRLLANP